MSMYQAYLKIICAKVLARHLNQMSQENMIEAIKLSSSDPSPNIDFAHVHVYPIKLPQGPAAG